MRWFALWLVVGVGLAFSAVSFIGLGPFVTVAALAGLLLIARQRHRLDRSAWGLAGGAGLLCLFVAYLNRKGPGVVAWHTATAASADQYPDPRPWLVAGLLLVVAGILGFAWRQQSDP